MTPSGYRNVMQVGRNSKFYYGVEAIHVPEMNGTKLTDDKQAQQAQDIMERVGRTTLAIASCLKTKFGRSVNDFGLAVHGERRAAFSRANPNVPVLVLKFIRDKIVEQNHFIPGCEKKLPGDCAGAALLLFQKLRRLSPEWSERHVEMTVDSEFTDLRKSDMDSWETGLVLTWKIVWKMPAKGPAERALTVVSNISIRTTDRSEAKDVGLDSLDSKAPSAAKSLTDVSSAHTLSKAPGSGGSNINTQDSQASARAPHVKKERDDSSSFPSVPTAGSNGTGESDDATAKVEAAAQVDKFE